MLFLLVFFFFFLDCLTNQVDDLSANGASLVFSEILKLCIEERDEWSAFGEFLAGIFAKYSDKVGLDDLPDPDVFFARKYIKDAYKAYMSHVNKKYGEKAMESIEYVFV